MYNSQKKKKKTKPRNSKPTSKNRPHKSIFPNLASKTQASVIPKH